MLTTCLVGDVAWSCTRGVATVAAADSAPRGPAHAATPSGRPRCKNADRRIRSAPRTPHNTPAERTSARKNLRRRTLGADPRAPPRSRSPTTLPAPVPADVADNAGAVRADAHDRSRWPDRHGSPGPAASAAPPPHTRRCNTGFADEA